ncbi:hypothetical protein PN498_19135 [Oscillatoria sp. CS-180]|uniref:hypothetical protein n=1 Tax=Oscillatoria sp. CS-180 TaxID=3021720 RepID=UPI00232B24DA|nr:hypothetical protein [Oscillatoria sp. CS-180]MDB9528115.1 hypothetical protein [Oscillatoria sp. CS-180]
MTSQQGQLQALITEIEALLGRATPKLPWSAANADSEQRQLMELALAYLKEFREAKTVLLDQAAVASDRTASSTLQETPDPYESAEATSHQVLQALLQEMQYLRVQMVQPLTNEVMTLQQQREALQNEVRELELNRSNRVDNPDTDRLNPAWISEVVDQLRASLLEQLIPQIRALQAQSNNPPLLYGTAQDPREAAADLPQLTPEQRLEQLQQVQAQTDYMLLKLDANLRAVFESLDQSIQSYSDTLNQGLDAMHGLGQQGEFIFRTFVNHLAQQMQQETGSYLTSSEAEDVARLEGREERPFEDSEASLSIDDDQMDAVVSLDEVNLEGISLDPEIDVDEEVTLFQLDGEFVGLQLDDSEDFDAIADVPAPDDDDEDKTIIQTEPIAWSALTGQSEEDSTPTEPASAQEEDAGYTEEIDSLYVSLFGDTEVVSDEVSSSDSEDAFLVDEDSTIEGDLEAGLVQSLLAANRSPDEMELAPTTESETADEEVTEVPLETSLETLIEPTAPLSEAETTDASAVLPEDPDASSSLETLLGTEIADELTTPAEEISSPRDTIASLAELLPDSETGGFQGVTDPFATFDESEDTFIPAPPNEDLLEGEGEAVETNLELTLDDDTLEKLTSDLSMLEDQSSPGLGVSSSLPFDTIDQGDVTSSIVETPESSDQPVDESFSLALDNLSLDLELPDFSEASAESEAPSEESLTVEDEGEGSLNEGAIADDLAINIGEDSNSVSNPTPSEDAVLEDTVPSFEDVIHSERLAEQPDNIFSLGDLDLDLSLDVETDTDPSPALADDFSLDSSEAPLLQDVESDTPESDTASDISDTTGVDDRSSSIADSRLPLTGSIAEGFSVASPEGRLDQQLVNWSTDIPDYASVDDDADFLADRPAEDTVVEAELLALQETTAAEEVRSPQSELNPAFQLTGSLDDGFQLVSSEQSSEADLADTLDVPPAVSAEDDSSSEWQDDFASDSPYRLYGQGLSSDEDQLISVTALSFPVAELSLAEIPEYDPDEPVASSEPEPSAADNEAFEEISTAPIDADAGLTLTGSPSEGYAVALLEQPEVESFTSSLDNLPNYDELDPNAAPAPERDASSVSLDDSSEADVAAASGDISESTLQSFQESELEFSAAEAEDSSQEDAFQTDLANAEPLETSLETSSESFDSDLSADDLSIQADADDLFDLAGEESDWITLESGQSDEAAVDIAEAQETPLENAPAEAAGPLSDDEFADFFPPQVPVSNDREQDTPASEDGLDFLFDDVAPADSTVNPEASESDASNLEGPELEVPDVELEVPDLASSAIAPAEEVTDSTLELTSADVDSETDFTELFPPVDSVSSLDEVLTEAPGEDAAISASSSMSLDAALNLDSIGFGTTDDVDMDLEEIAATPSETEDSAQQLFEESSDRSDEVTSPNPTPVSEDWDPLTLDFEITDEIDNKLELSSGPDSGSSEAAETRDPEAITSDPSLFAAGLDLSFEEMSEAELENDDAFRSAFDDDFSASVTDSESASKADTDTAAEFSVIFDEADSTDDVSESVSFEDALSFEASPTIADDPSIDSTLTEDLPATDEELSATDDVSPVVEEDTITDEDLSATDDVSPAMEEDTIADLNDLFNQQESTEVASTELPSVEDFEESSSDDDVEEPLITDEDLFVTDAIAAVDLDVPVDREDEIGTAPVELPSVEEEDSSEETLADEAVFASSSVLATIPTEEPGDEDPESTSESDSPEEEWFLGLDFGSNGLSAVLMEHVSGSAHPLCWFPLSNDDSTQPTYRMPAVASMRTNPEAATELHLNAVGLAALSETSENADVLINTLKPLLKIGIPHQTTSGRWEPTIQWTTDQAVSLQQVLMSTQALLELITQAHAVSLRLEAVGLETSLLYDVLDNLQGVVVGIPSNWPDTYCINLREAVLSAGLVASPGQIFFLEEAIAAVLSGLPDPHEPLPEQNRQAQTLYQCNWQGGTVVISSGSICTEVGTVDLPRPLDALSHEDFKLRNLAYGGDALDLDIICQLLVPAERRQSVTASDRRASRDGWGWQATSPDVANARWEELQIEALDLPQLAEPDLGERIRLRRHLESSKLGQSLLEAARYLKLILQHQNQYQLQLADQSWKVLRRDLESRVLVPYIQRLNQQVNSLLSQTGLSAQGINQVICTGGNASFSTIAKWLRQKFPNATIIQDTYPSNRPQTCSRVAYGLANLCRYPQVLDISRHQYSDYFLLHEIVRVVPGTPMPFEGILHLLTEQGINTDACRSRIEAILEGHLPPGFVPDASTQDYFAEASLMSELSQALTSRPLLTQQTRQIYMLNEQQRDRIQNYLAALMLNKHQTLTEPMIAELVTL